MWTRYQCRWFDHKFVFLLSRQSASRFDKSQRTATPTSRPKLDDEDRNAILARRNRFIGLALSGMAVVGCGDDEATPMPCLGPMEVEVSPQPCLSDMPDEEKVPDPLPMPCLAPPLQDHEIDAPLMPMHPAQTGSPIDGDDGE